MIVTENLSKRFGPITALDGLDLRVREGELYAFLGPNGAGKTTLIRILNSLSRMDEGRAAIGGLDLAADPDGVKRLCGLAAQTANLDGDLTVMENLDFHGRLYGMDRRTRWTRSGELLEYVELSDRAASPVRTLSGGLRRRLMVARALLHRPRVLFLDEPTTGLDPAIRRRIWSLVRKVRGDGVTVFLTTHYIEEAEFLADRVAFLLGGRLIAQGTPGDMIARVGVWAVDHPDEESLDARYFPGRDDARRYVESCDRAVTLRRVNLEDAFLALTGRKVN